MLFLKFIKKIEKIVEWIDFPLEIAAIASFAWSGCLLFIAVILRYIFNFSHEWIEELTLFSLIFAVFLYGGPAYRKGSHIGMEFFSSKYKGKTKIIYHFFFNIILIAICGIMVYAGMQIEKMLYMTQMVTQSESLKLWIVFICIPIGLAIYGFYGFAALMKDIFLLLNPDTESLDFPHHKGP